MSTDSFGYDENIPEDIREVFMWLCDEVVALHREWQFYLHLFANEENAALVTELARGSFHIIEASVRNDMTMTICRLSDPAQTGVNENLSMARLSRKGSPAVQQLLTDFTKACEPVRTLRNKLIGHHDLKTRIKPHENPLPGIGRKQIDLIVELSGRILTAFLRQYVNAELRFEPIEIGSADDLVYCLKVAKRVIRP